MSISLSVISSVNYCEALTKLIDRGLSDEDAKKLIEFLRLEVIEFGENSALRAASLRSATKSFGLSLGDRCCLALGQELDTTVVTAERIWVKLNVEVTIALIG